MNHSEKANTINRGICLSIIFAILALMTGLLAITQPARAITPTPHLVKNSNDTGKDSLRWAIGEANKTPGDDLITFDKTTDGNPIKLGKGSGEDANLTGDLDIWDRGDLIIQGNGADKTIIDGQTYDRVFHICPAAPVGGCANTVTFTGVTIRNGSANYGGGIFNVSAAAIVDSSTIISNTAGSNGGGIFNGGKLTVRNGSTIGQAGAANAAISNGGGIFNRGGTTTVDASTVSANTAANGGGIYTTGTLFVQNGSTIGAANDASTSGGGIYNMAGTTTVDASTVSANTAGIGGGIFNYATLVVRNGSNIGPANDAIIGGGIYNASGTTTVDASTVNANTAVGGGGGIYNADTTTLIGSTVSANEAKYGGGIYSEGSLNIEKGSTIGGANIADNNGGGIYIETGTTIVDASTVSANEADYGGGIASEATLFVQNGSTIGGVGAGNLAGNGAGIYISDGTTTVDASAVSDNEATSDGGGIHSYATLDVENGSTIGGKDAGNSAGGHGGGIYVEYGTTTVDSSTVSDNLAFDNGGGIWSQGELIVKNGSTIGGDGAGNWAEDDGGGIFNWDGTAAVNDSTISYNEADYHGGGIRNGGYMTVTNSIILTNTAVSSGGGIVNYHHMTVNGSTVSANEAGNGGGIYNWHGTTTVTASTVSANTAVLEGGGIYNDDEMTVTASTVSANKAGSSGGGIANHDTLIIQNGSTIGGSGAGNEAIYGGGIHNPGGTTTVNASTISANTAEDKGGGVYNKATLIILNDSTIGGAGAGNTAKYGGGIFTEGAGESKVTGSRILSNSAIIQGGGVHNHRDVALATSVTESCIVGNSEKSFYNNVDKQQIATSNWWGAAGGPNTPGADTVNEYVNISGFKTAPILNCAPDLRVGKANDNGGDGTVGKPFHWTLTVSNSGLISATFAEDQTILVDDLPAGPTYGDPLAGSIVNVTNHDKIHCSLAENTITCKAIGGDVTLAPLTGSFDVTISVTSDAPATLTNPKAGGTCKVDPGGNIPENDDSNNDCPVNIVDVSLSFSYLYLPVMLK